MTSDILYLVSYTVYSLNEPSRHKSKFNNAKVILVMGMWLCTKWQCSLPLPTDTKNDYLSESLTTDTLFVVIVIWQDSHTLHFRNILLYNFFLPYFLCEWFSFTREMAIKRFFVLTKVPIFSKIYGYCILHRTFPMPLFRSQMHLIFKVPYLTRFLMNHIEILPMVSHI